MLAVLTVAWMANHWADMLAIWWVVRKAAKTVMRLAAGMDDGTVVHSAAWMVEHWVG